MREHLRGVLRLQPERSAENTPAMQRRGDLLRNGVAGWLDEQLPALRTHAPVEMDDWKVKASDGAGNKSVIPWVRVYSDARSPEATKGWYVVYLFQARGDRVYLSLMQGSSEQRGREFKPRPLQGLRERSERARAVLADRLRERPDLVDVISLEATNTKLGRAYEAGTVVAFEYPVDAMPSDDVLRNDLIFLASVLGYLYELPDDMAPEVADAVVAADRSAGKSRRGQGFLLNAAERTAIERRAVAVATEYLVEQGYEVADVGATESYDLDARGGEEHLYVEVKGTTGMWTSASEIILTKNEVDLHLQKYPDNMLLIVSSIVLDRAATPPSASGGKLKAIHPWLIAPANLTPLSFRYLVGE
ncbi:DUF3578 domain-containing protein [Lentzea sp. NPDC051838]|uniref:MrcB family domain-containing protein n=1 Tax=Lentzea sp. NPDC051838 TaxID=3154849 RepID=UPI0034399480